MIWSRVGAFHWQATQENLIAEVKIVKDKEQVGWRVTQNGNVLLKGTQPHAVEAMNAAASFMDSVAVKEQSKSEIVKEWCEARGIDMMDIPLVKSIIPQHSVPR